jgi:hypothetical protein
MSKRVTVAKKRPGAKNEKKYASQTTGAKSALWKAGLQTNYPLGP